MGCRRMVSSLATGAHGNHAEEFQKQNEHDCPNCQALPINDISCIFMLYKPWKMYLDCMIHLWFLAQIGSITMKDAGHSGSLIPMGRSFRWFNFGDHHFGFGLPQIDGLDLHELPRTPGAISPHSPAFSGHFASCAPWRSCHLSLCTSIGSSSSMSSSCGGGRCRQNT